MNAFELILTSLPSTYSAPPNISRADPAPPPAALMSLSSGHCSVVMVSYVDWCTVYVIMPNRSSTSGAQNVERRLLMTASPANAKTAVVSAPAADSHPPVGGENDDVVFVACPCAKATSTATARRGPSRELVCLSIVLKYVSKTDDINLSVGLGCFMTPSRETPAAACTATPGYKFCSHACQPDPVPHYSVCTSSMRISIYATVGRIDCNEWRAAYNNNNDHPTSHPKGVTAEALHYFR